MLYSKTLLDTESIYFEHDICFLFMPYNNTSSAGKSFILPCVMHVVVISYALMLASSHLIFTPFHLYNLHFFSYKGLNFFLANGWWVHYQNLSISSFSNNYMFYFSEVSPATLGLGGIGKMQWLVHQTVNSI